MEIFAFRVFYSIYREALIDTELTSSVKKLFQPIFDIRGPFPNNQKKKDEGLDLEIDTRRASEWTSPRGVRKDVALAAQNDADVLEDVVYNFETDIIPNDLLPEKVVSTLDSLCKRAVECNVDDNIMVNIQNARTNNKIAEAYAQLFICSLYFDSASKGKKSVPEPTTEALDEFEKAIRKKYSKPKTVVPEDVANEEMNYVNELLGVYEEASGEAYDGPDDVKGTEYEGHFRQQRKNYYQAELIHREIRDVVRKDEDEGFETLKEEIEDGIYSVAHRHYDLGYDKAEAVLDRAGSLNLSQNTDSNMLGWVGPGERRGVCHMLVNEKRLKWLEDGKDEE